MKIKLEVNLAETLLLSQALMRLESREGANITDRNMALNLRERIINDAASQIIKNNEQELSEEIE